MQRFLAVGKSFFGSTRSLITGQIRVPVGHNESGPTVRSLQTLTFQKPSVVHEAVSQNKISTLPQRNVQTINQMHRNGPFRKERKKNKLTDGQPQMKGVVLRTFVKKPKKPNSANRKCVRLRLSNGREAIAYVPGEGHNLQEHSVVLVNPANVQDLPGVRLKCIRGKYDLAHVIKK